MPAKYHIHTVPIPPRFPPIGKFGTIDFMESCLGCGNCVKKRACVYDLYRQEYEYLRQAHPQLDYLYLCKNCYRCIQECTKGILSRAVNPQYLNMGNDYWTADIIDVTWYQAETGKIPVSGAGYRGPFSGPGFDSMWTDMSEIVRPTRDGIHGREYISTTVDFGRKLDKIDFADLETSYAGFLFTELPLPIIFNTLPKEKSAPSVLRAAVAAAAEMETFIIVRQADISEELDPYMDFIIPCFDSFDPAQSKKFLTKVRAIEIPYSENIRKQLDHIRRINPALLIMINVPADRRTASKVVELTQAGADVIHIAADDHGRELEDDPRFIKEVLRETHQALVDCSLRDRVTILASGGIALAEHMAKAIVCGADLIAVDLPLILALECRLCQDCVLPACPVELDRIEIGYGKQRILNLMAAWRNQLLEVLGAMGLREVRRLRGETGRAMFFEDLEAETFGKLFGRKKKNETIAAS